jgi:hypothetical protein
MLAAAVATGRSTYLYWLPCRESMLRGIIQGYGHGKFSDECSGQMDGGERRLHPVDVRSQPRRDGAARGGLAHARSGAAVAAEDYSRCGTSWCGAVAVALVGAAGPDRYEWSLLLMMGLAVIMEVLAVGALLWIVAWQPEVRARQILRLVIVLWGTTAFGVVHVYIEHVIMIGFRFSTWDPPPGFGYLIFATITISAILTVILTVARHRRMPTMSRVRTTIQGCSPSPERRTNRDLFPSCGLG